jgi:hypothetical protein
VVLACPARNYPAHRNDRNRTSSWSQANYQKSNSCHSGAPAERWTAHQGQSVRPPRRHQILIVYRHGFRVSELVDLRWDQIDFDTANLLTKP